MKRAQLKDELLIEHRYSPVKVLESEGPGDGTVVFEAVVSEADYVNGNRRLYPETILFPAFEAISTNLARYPGAVDHPDPYEPLSVSDQGIAWERFWTEGKQVIGRGRTILTQKGRDLAAVLLAGIEIGFSTRGRGESDEQTLAGQTVRVLTKFVLEAVDAVVTPSVGQARVRSFAKESLELETELETAQEAQVAAERTATEATQRAEAAEGRLAEAEQARDTATARVTVLEGEIVTLQAELTQLRTAEGENALIARINDLTAEHRFGAAIRTEIAELRNSGITVTLENVEALVSRFRALVEATASSESAAPRGDLSTDEDAPAEESAPKYTDEEREQLRLAGLI